VKRFALLFAEIDGTTRTNAKVDAMVRYFSDVDPADGAWAVHFLSGERPKRLIGVRKLVDWATAETGVPGWLFDECYEAVGDLAEAIALLLPRRSATSDLPLHVWIEQRLLPIARQSDAQQRESMLRAWRELDGMERFVWNKMITGALRIGVSQQLVIRALAKALGVEEGIVAHRLSGDWQPSAAAFQALGTLDATDADVSRPYPFYLAYALEDPLESLGDAAEWSAEWKWDGIRAQVLRRNATSYIWSRGEELVTERFPEVADAATYLADGTVLDGELMPWKDGAPLPFAQLQRRIGRKSLGAALLNEVPVVLVTYDLLEDGGRDVRGETFVWRRRRLAEVLREARSTAFILSPALDVSSWGDVRAAYSQARDIGAEGLMLKRHDAEYGVGRRKGGWWKWKLQPFSVDAVLLYAQAGHGRRASLHTDYTFAVWDDGKLVPFAKAYSGLTDEEIRELDAWIRRNTVEKFGPVRHVRPEHVFELGFEGIQASARHKSGVAVRFPRILRWRTEKRPEDADSIETLRSLMLEHA
jgi:DNA ligase-1